MSRPDGMACWRKVPKRWKYISYGAFSLNTPLRPPKTVMLSFVELSTDGRLFILPGYAWDGPSGPLTMHTKTFMRASMVHDALYQLLRSGRLGLPVGKPDLSSWGRLRLQADELMRTIALADGMTAARAWVVFKAVRAFGHAAAMPRLAVTRKVICMGGPDGRE